MGTICLILSTSSPAGLSRVDQLHQARRSYRRLCHLHAERLQRVFDRRDYGGRRRNTTAFTDPFDAERIHR